MDLAPHSNSPKAMNDAAAPPQVATGRRAGEAFDNERRRVAFRVRVSRPR